MLLNKLLRSLFIFILRQAMTFLQTVWNAYFVIFKIQIAKKKLLKYASDLLLPSSAEDKIYALS